MNYRLTIACTLACALGSLASLQAANIPEGDQSVVAYRLGRWKTLHFNDAQKARRHYDALQRLGCEAKTHDHAGHIDVTYRQPTWTPLSLASDEVAHQWERWLIGAGFETLHGHAADAGHNHDHGHGSHDHGSHSHGAQAHEGVAYRMGDWRTIRVPDADVGEFVAIAKALGCEVRQESREGVSDVSIRCVGWNHAEFASHADAVNWERWLKTTGFEARHEHGDDHNHQHDDGHNHQH